MSWPLSWVKSRFAPRPVQVLSSRVAAAVMVAARGQLGCGEEGANNKGPDIDRYRTDRTGRYGSGGAWCAAFVCWCIDQSELRYQRSHRAKTLFDNLLRAGATRVDVPSVGDVALWHRGAANATTGHVGLVSMVGPGSHFKSIEGNRGGYQSLVREYPHELGEALLLGFARLP